jgi:hypothetical protein
MAEYLSKCSECGGLEHIPEECPAATLHDTVFGGGACEADYAYSPEGRRELAGIPWGTEAWYQAVIDGTEMSHAVGSCGAHR